MAIPEIIVFKYGSQIGESASSINLMKDYLCLNSPNSKGVSILVLIHFSATSFMNA